MKFRFVVEIDVKNDELTRDAGRQDIATMLQDHLEKNKLDALPWVVDTRYIFVRGM